MLQWQKQSALWFRNLQYGNKYSPNRSCGSKTDGTRNEGNAGNASSKEEINKAAFLTVWLIYTGYCYYTLHLCTSLARRKWFGYEMDRRDFRQRKMRLRGDRTANKKPKTIESLLNHRSKRVYGSITGKPLLLNVEWIDKWFKCDGFVALVVEKNRDRIKPMGSNGKSFA